MTPFKSLHTLDSYMCCYLNDPQRVLFSDSCSWVPCLSWTVQLSAVLQKNPSAPTNYLVFQAYLCIWTLSNNDCMILRSIFSHRGQLRDSFATITEDYNSKLLQKIIIVNYYRRFKRSLMLQKEKKHALGARAWKLLNRMKMGIFILFCLNILFVPLVLPFRSYRR